MPYSKLEISEGLSAFYKRNVDTFKPVTYVPLEVQYTVQHLGSSQTERKPLPEQPVATPAHTLKPPLHIDHLTPNHGPQAGSQTVTIVGTGFVQGCVVHFITATDVVQAQTANVKSDGTEVYIITHVLTDTTDLTVDVKVVNPDSTTDTYVDGYFYDPGPRVDAIDPNTGTTAGGTVFTIYGSNFVNRTDGSGLDVYFGSAKATVTSATTGGTKVIGNTPAHAAGSVDVKVVNPDNSSGVLPLGFTYGSGATLAAIDYSLDGVNFRFQSGLAQTIDNAVTYNVRLRALTTIFPYVIDTTHTGTYQILIGYFTDSEVVFGTIPGIGQNITFAAGLSSFFFEAGWPPGNGTSQFIGLLLKNTVSGVQYLVEFNYNKI